MTGVRELPVARLATTLAPLRGPRTDAASALAPLPLRVAATGDGTYEVLDGFKRLATWTRAGHTHVPVVVEDAPGVVGKARLLEANAPRRTLSPMDEARVVRALADDDQLSPAQIAKLLGRGRGWVDRRLTLGRRLAPAVAGHVDAGRLSATTATTLAAVSRGDQPRLADAILRHGLRTREADVFLLARRARHDHPRGAAARSAGRGATTPPPRRLAARRDRPRASGALRSDRARPRRIAVARSHRLRRPRPPGPGSLPTAPGRAGRPARPHRPAQGGGCPC